MKPSLRNQTETAVFLYYLQYLSANYEKQLKTVYVQSKFNKLNISQASILNILI